MSHVQVFANSGNMHHLPVKGNHNQNHPASIEGQSISLMNAHWVYCLSSSQR